MATIYICKCGRRVRKSTNADNTGSRDTAGCRGCPYLLPWGPFEFVKSQGFVRNVKGYECRMSKDIEYATRFCGSIDDKCSCYIASLDFDFLTRVSNWIKETYPGGELNGSFFTDDIRAVEYVSNGRYRMSIGCAQNKKGIAAKAALLHQFFDASGARLDMTPEEEKVHILAAIEAGKAKASGKEKDMQVYTNQYGTLFAVREHNGSPALMCKAKESEQWVMSGVLAAVKDDAKTIGELQAVLDKAAQKYNWEPVENVPVENPTNAAEDVQQCAPTASDAPTLPSPSANADAQQGVGDNPANPTHAAPVSPVDAGAATQSPSDAAPASLEVESELDVAMKGHSSEECQECGISSDKCRCKECLREGCRDYPGTAYCVIGNNVCPGMVMKETSIPGADGSTAFDYSGLDDQTVADDVCPYLELIENSKKYSCQCSICGDRFVNTEICNKTFLSCGWYLDQQDKDALNHSEENTDKDNCLCRTCGSEECPGRGCSKECPNGSEGSCFTATCPGYIERTDIICKDKVTNAPSADAAATSDGSAARMCEGPDEETQTTPAAASGAALESLHAQSALPQNAPAQDIAADAPSAQAFDYSGLGDGTNVLTGSCELRAFDFSELGEQLAEQAAEADKQFNLHYGKAQDEYLVSCIYLARIHELTAKAGRYGGGTWTAWYQSKGISEGSARTMVQNGDGFKSASVADLKNLPVLTKKDLNLIARNGVANQVVEAAGEGDSDRIQDILNQLKAVQTERDEARKAKEKAEQERDAARDAQAASSRLTNMITNQRDEAQIRAERAELRAKAAEEDAAGWKQAGLEMQELVDQRDERIRELESGITVETTAADQEEIERRANELSEPLVKIINQQNEEIQQLAAGNTVSAQASVLEHYLKTMEASLLSNAQRAELASYDIGALDSLARALREFADSIDGIFEDRSEDND